MNHLSFQVRRLGSEKPPPEVPGSCLIWTHEQSNTNTNPKAHPKANANTHSYTSVKPCELAILTRVHVFWIEAMSNFPIWLIIIICLCDLHKRKWDHKLVSSRETKWNTNSGRFCLPEQALETKWIKAHLRPHWNCASLSFSCQKGYLIQWEIQSYKTAL